MNSDLLKADFLLWDPFFLKIFANLKPTAQLYEIPPSLNLESSLNSIEKLWAEETKKTNPSLFKCFLRLFWPQIVSFSLVHSIAHFQKTYIAIMIKLLIDDLSNNENNKSGYLVSGIIFCSIIMIVLKSFSEYRMILLSGKVRSLIILMINKKVLKVNYNSIDFGKILSTTGAELEVFDFIAYTPFMIGTPLLILNSSLIISYFADVSGLIGIGISIVHIPLIFGISIITGKKRNSCSQISDKRVKLVSSFIEGIKVFKFYAWEMEFLKKIKALRNREIKMRYQIANINTINIVLASCGISLCIFVTFYVHLKQLKTPISLSQMYLIITIFFSTHLQIVYMNTIAILTTILMKASMARISNILLLPETENPQIFDEKNPAVSFKSCSFSPKKPEKSQILTTAENLKETTNPNLIHNITFSLNKGQVCVIVGQVGSGKSVLLQSMLNEFYLTEGRYLVSGQVSYASEVPWIFSGTIRQNILMGLPYDKSRYDQVVYSCSLQEDFSQLANSDESWVGDRGVTLSGGQKARLNLARALYRECDVLLLDDPLSAVDANVACHIFNNCVMGSKKTGKSVIVTTHQLRFVGNADRVIVMHENTIKYFGKPKDLEENRNIVELINDAPCVIRDKSCFDEQGVRKVYEENEEEMQENYGFGVVVEYFKKGFRKLWLFLLGALLVSAMQFFIQAQVYWSSHREDVIDRGDSYFLDGLAALTGLWYASTIIAIVYWTNVVVKCNSKLNNKSLKSVANATMTFFDNNPSGRITNRFSKDLFNCDGPLHFYIIDCIITVPFILTSIIVQLIIAPIVLVSIPFYILVIFYFMYKASKITTGFRKKESLSRAPILSFLTSSLEGLLTIRAQRSESYFLTEMKEKVDHYFRCFFTYQSFLRFSQFYCDLASLIIVSVNLIVLVTYQSHLDIKLTAYSLSTCMNLVAISSISFKNIFEARSLFASVQRLLEYQSLPQEPLKCESKLLITSGRIEFRDVSFRYQNCLPLVLSDLCFTINPREKIGIVGRTGSGKSSILYVLFRLGEPAKGSVFIDDNDYKNSDLRELRRQISIIPQSATLFSTTLRDNLDPFGAYSDDEIWKALRLVQLDSVIRTQKAELNVKLDGSEVKLSAGQRQLVCIARAILIKNKIVVMDEATSNIDMHTDKLIQRIIREEFVGATMLTIAHRILTAADSNRVLVMDNGRCVEFDTPVELFRDRKSIFYQLCEKSGVGVDNLLSRTS